MIKCCTLVPIGGARAASAFTNVAAVKQVIRMRYANTTDSDIDFYYHDCQHLSPTRRGGDGRGRERKGRRRGRRRGRGEEREVEMEKGRDGRDSEREVERRGRGRERKWGVKIYRQTDKEIGI